MTMIVQEYLQNVKHTGHLSEHQYPARNARKSIMQLHGLPEKYDITMIHLKPRFTCDFLLSVVVEEDPMFVACLVRPDALIQQIIVQHC